MNNDNSSDKNYILELQEKGKTMGILGIAAQTRHLTYNFLSVGGPQPCGAFKVMKIVHYSQLVKNLMQEHNVDHKTAVEGVACLRANFQY